MDLNTTGNYTGSRPPPLHNYRGDHGFPLNAGNAVATAGGTTNAGSSTQINYNTFTDDSEALFGTGNPMTSDGYPSPTPYIACASATCFFGSALTGGSITDSSYSMTQEILISA